MKKLTCLLLCMVLVLSAFGVNAAAAETDCMEAGVTVADDGTVMVAVTGKLPAANARLTVDFDSDYLTYVGSETPFAVHSVKEEDGKLTIGLANSSNADETLELVELCFEKTGRWDETSLAVNAVRYGGKTVDESVSLAVVGEGYRFDDVVARKWYFEAVDYMASKGYILGITDRCFGPEESMTRAAFVTLLGRMEGVEKRNVQTQFHDVPVNSYYSGYVAWAVEQGITTGMTATQFAPNEPVNRAQMVTFLYRYAKSEGNDVSVADPEGALSQFPDGNDLPRYSRDAFAWAVEQGIINGMGGRLAPEGIATRAQGAVMLHRFFFED